MNNAPVAPGLTEYLHRKAVAAGVPLSGSFELTPLCNMDCKMCYVRMEKKTQQALSPLAGADRWLDLGKKAMQAGMLYLLLTGGEPFLHPQFRQILEGLHKLGLVLTINSNGTLIDEEVVQWLRRCPPSRINISLYGASDETYGRLCGNPKGFTQVKKAIDLLRDAKIPVKLNCSLTPYNAGDLAEMVTFAREKGLVLQVGTYMFPPVRKADPAGDHRFSPEEAAYYTAYADYLTLGADRFAAQEYAPVVPGDESCDAVGDGIRCRAGKCSFWVTWMGQLTPCGMFPPAGYPSVFEEDFQKAWQQVKDKVCQIRLPAKCSQCSALESCRACAAMVVAESGSFDCVPKYRCEMTQAMQGQWLRVKEEML